MTSDDNNDELAEYKRVWLESANNFVFSPLDKDQPLFDANIPKEKLFLTFPDHYGYQKACQQFPAFARVCLRRYDDKHLVTAVGEVQAILGQTWEDLRGERLRPEVLREAARKIVEGSGALPGVSGIVTRPATSLDYHLFFCHFLAFDPHTGPFRDKGISERNIKTAGMVFTKIGALFPMLKESRLQTVRHIYGSLIRAAMERNGLTDEDAEEVLRTIEVIKLASHDLAAERNAILEEVAQMDDDYAPEDLSEYGATLEWEPPGTDVVNTNDDPARHAVAADAVLA